MKTHGFKNGVRWRTILVASSVGLTASAALASPASAATLFCSGTVGAVTVDSVEVAANDTCRLEGTTVLGSITAHSGATLIATDVQVSGSITGDGIAVLELTGATTVVQGSVKAVKGGQALIAGADIAGGLTIEEMFGTVSVGGVTTGSSMQVTKNTGGATIANNTILGALQCFDNAPAPAVAGNSADALEGQCIQAVSPPPPTPPSGNVTCVGLTIVGLNLDSVIVPDNTNCTLIGANMNGSVEVGANSTLIAQDVAITGNLLADGAANVTLSGASTIGGSVQIQSGAGASIHGARVSGSMQIFSMAGPVDASGNVLGGNLQAVSNRGGVSITDNRMGGALQCSGNLPAPIGGGNVASQRDGQCATL